MTRKSQRFQWCLLLYAIYMTSSVYGKEIIAKETKKMSNWTEGLSARAGIPESPYYVRRTSDNKLVEGCFVLRPTKEPKALVALLEFASLLPEQDSRREELVGWIRILDAFWKATEEFDRVKNDKRTRTIK